MCVGSLTAGTLSSSQSRPDNEFETDRRVWRRRGGRPRHHHEQEGYRCEQEGYQCDSDHYGFFAIPIATDLTITLSPVTSPTTLAILPASLPSSILSLSLEVFSVYTLSPTTSA